MTTGKPGNTGIKRIVKATGYSIQGLKAAFKHEAAIRQELGLLVFAIVLVSLFDVTMVERILMLGVVVLVLIVELLNSAVEAVVDRVGVEYHELSGEQKILALPRFWLLLVLPVLPGLTSSQAIICFNG